MIFKKRDEEEGSALTLWRRVGHRRLGRRGAGACPLQTTGLLRVSDQILFPAYGAPPGGKCDNMIEMVMLVTNLVKGNKCGVGVELERRPEEREEEHRTPSLTQFKNPKENGGRL